MKELFESESLKETSIKIGVKGTAKLTKNQTLFNKLSAKIEALEANIVEEDLRMSRLMDYFNKKVRIHINSIADVKYNLATKIAETTKLYKFNKKQLKKIKEAIINLCESSFGYSDPSEAQLAFYKSWANEDEDQDEIQNAKIDQLADLADFLGFEFDKENFKGTEEDFQKIVDDMQQKYAQDRQNSDRARKKSKKELEKEAKLKEEEAIKTKSIRSIYIALAKVLHPDTETDIILKLEKEELMKTLTVAYDNKDLLTLLKLESEWLKKTSEHLDEMADSTLKIYIDALKQQVEDLEVEKYEMYKKYQPVYEYKDIMEKTGFKKINKEAKDMKHIIENHENIIKFIGLGTSKKQVFNILENYVLLDEEEDDELDDDTFGRMINEFFKR